MALFSMNESTQSLTWTQVVQAAAKKKLVIVETEGEKGANRRWYTIPRIFGQTAILKAPWGFQFRIRDETRGKPLIGVLDLDEPHDLVFVSRPTRPPLRVIPRFIQEPAADKEALAFVLPQVPGDHRGTTCLVVTTTGKLFHGFYDAVMKISRPVNPPTPRTDPLPAWAADKLKFLIDDPADFISVLEASPEDHRIRKARAKKGPLAPTTLQEYWRHG